MSEATRQWICQSANCGVRYEGTERTCPQCGRTAALASAMKLRGVAALVAGLFLVGLMSVLMLALGPQLLGYSVQGSNTSFNGSGSDGLVILALFAAIWLFGLVAIASGWAMIARGRRSVALFVLMLPPLLVIVGIVALILNGYVLKSPA